MKIFVTILLTITWLYCMVLDTTRISHSIVKIILIIFSIVGMVYLWNL